MKKDEVPIEQINNADRVLVNEILKEYTKETLLDTRYCKTFIEENTSCKNCLTKIQCKNLLIGKKLNAVLLILIKYQDSILLKDFIAAKEFIITSIFTLLK